MTQLDELLSAARSLDETPPPEAGARMWANVAARVAGGAAIGVAVATVGAKSAAASASASTAAATATATSSLGLTLAKIGVAVALTTGIGIGVATVASDPEPEPAPVTAVADVEEDEPAPAKQPKPAADVIEIEEVEDVVEIVDEPASIETTEQTAKKARPRKRPKPSTPSLAAESDLLGKAKVAASGGRNKAALAAIREHASKYPNGELAEVRRALEVEVLCDLGRKGDARKAADRFLERHRSSALAGQVRSSCAYGE